MQEKPNSTSTVPISRVRQLAVTSAGKPPAAATTRSRVITQRVHCADDLRIGVRAIARAYVFGDIGDPFGTLGFGKVDPRGRGLITSQRCVKRAQAKFCIPHYGQRHVLARIMARDVQPDDLGVLGKGRPRPRGEILQPAAHRQDHIGRFGHCIGAVRSGHAQWPDVQRMACQHVGTPAMVSITGILVRFGKGRQSRPRHRNTARHRPR